MSEAAKLLGVTNPVIRRLIKHNILAAEQIRPGAPYQIRGADLEDEHVTATLGHKDHACRNNLEANSQGLQILEEGAHSESPWR
jgi:excisionase family DNA binding protein